MNITEDLWEHYGFSVHFILIFFVHNNEDVVNQILYFVAYVLLLFQSLVRSESGSRQFTGGTRGQLPSIRSVPSPSARQSPFQGMGPPTPGSTGQGDPISYPSSPQQGQPSLIYQHPQQQQQQPQYHLQRTLSAPAAPMQGKI